MAREAAGISLRGLSGELLDRLGFGLLVTGADGAVQSSNATARRLAVEAFGAWPAEPSCCSLLGCKVREPLAGHCLSELASNADEALPELRVDLPAERPTRAVWVAAARMADNGSPVLIHLRPAEVDDRRRRTRPHWMAGPRLLIRALGRTQVETEETTIEGRWLMQRPGHLLKYLVAQRGRPAHVDEIAEALWPKAGVSGRSSVRYFVHTLRHLLEPARAPRAQSQFIVSVKGTYALDPRVKLDAEEFEALASAGFRRAKGTVTPEAAALLDEAMSLYRGDLFQEEPFAAWAFPERERLRTIALRALHALVDFYKQAGEPGTALERLERFGELWPMDTDVQRLLIELYLRQGRRDDAHRRYAALRHRLLEEFKEEPEFELTDLQANL